MAVKDRLATLLVLMPQLLWKAEATNPVTCTAVTTRYNTTVVCDFGLDISKTQHGFNIQFYDPDNTAEAKTVLACNFMEGGDLICHEGSGIQFDKHKVGDQVQVIGPAAVDKVGGRYACQLAPAVGRIETCNLTYTHIPTEPPATSEKPTSESDNIDSISSIADLLRVNNRLLIVIIIVIIIVAVIAVVLYCKRERDRGSGPTRPSHGDIEATEGHGSRVALNKRSTHFFSLCGRCRGGKPQEPEAVPLKEPPNTPIKQSTAATSAEPKWKRLCCSCKASATGESRESKGDDAQESPPKMEEKETPAENRQEEDATSAEILE